MQWLSGLIILLHLPRLFGWDTATQTLFAYLAFIPLRYQSLEYLFVNPIASLLSPIGYSLIHADGVHLLVNLAMLAAFGRIVVLICGIRIFILLCILGSLAGSSLHLMVAQNIQIPLIGASAAVSALIGAMTCLGIAQKHPMPRPFDSRKRSLQFLLIWIAINLLFGLLPYAENITIAWHSHLAGLIAGYLYIHFRLV